MPAAAKALIAFPITPCDAAGRVEAAALRGLLARLAAARVDAVGLLGSTGSYPYLDRAERRRVLEIGVETLGAAVPILAGVGALRTDAAVALAQDAKAIGATAGLLAPMSYTPLTEPEVFAHFEAVAVEGGLPIHVYDNPSTTHFSFSPALVARLARVPGIVALKSPAPSAGAVGAHLGALRAGTPPGFSIGCSVDWHAAAALMAGAEAWYSVAAGLFPAPCLTLIEALATSPEAGRAEEARLAPLWDLFRRHTSLRTVYAAANILGLCRAAPPRPILPLDAAAQAEVAAALRAGGFS